MKHLLPALALIIATAAAAWSQPAAPSKGDGMVLFSDDFSSNGFGKRWGHYKSGSVVKDGVLVGITPEGSDHSAVDNIVIEPHKDLEVSVKFRYVSEKAKSFNVWFDDKGFKGAHAGHICRVTVSPKNVMISDAKTGDFRIDLYTKRKAGTELSAEEKAMIRTKFTNVPVALPLKDWHTLVITSRGDELAVEIDGKKVGSFKSEGIAHDTKTLISLTTNQVDVEYDDFSIKALGR